MANTNSLTNNTGFALTLIWKDHTYIVLNPGGTQGNVSDCNDITTATENSLTYGPPSGSFVNGDAYTATVSGSGLTFTDTTNAANPPVTFSQAALRSR